MWLPLTDHLVRFDGFTRTGVGLIQRGIKKSIEFSNDNIGRFLVYDADRFLEP